MKSLKKGNRKIFLLLMLVLIVSFSLLSCKKKEFLDLNNNVIASHFPNNDIVFRLDGESMGITDELGFINADGRNLIRFPLGKDWLMHYPSWTDDGSLIFFADQLYLLKKSG